MIYLAAPEEAVRCIARRYGMMAVKPEPGVYESGGLILAAGDDVCALDAMVAERPPCADDIYACILVSYDANDIYLVSAVSDPATGYSFYPEMLFKCPFRETAAADGALVRLVRSAASFFRHHNIYAFYITGDGQETEEAVYRILIWLKARAEFKSLFGASPFTDTEKALLNSIACSLRLTETMRLELETLARREKNRRGSLEALNGFWVEGVVTKKEAKAVYARFREFTSVN